MDANEKALLAEAVETLATDDGAERMYKQLLLVYDAASGGLPVRLTGRPSVLNPILELMLEDYDTAGRVLDLIDRKRSQAGREPLDNGGFSRKPYMSKLMADKRARQKRFVIAWNQLRPERDALRGTARMEFERIHAARWMTVKLEREDEARARLGRRLTNEERARMTEQFWADVDAEIDALEDYAQQEMRKPATARGAGFEFRLKPKKG